MTENIHSDPFEGVCGALRGAIVRRGFSELTAVQRAVVAAPSRERNLRISSQTGSGKTLAMGLALADELVDGAPRTDPKSPLAIVITPTRELAVQVRDELAWLYEDVPHLDVVAVTGGTEIDRERRLLSRRPALVVGTPGRLLDHLRTGALACGDVRHVFLDEADRMLDMGFRDDLESITQCLPEQRRRHLVSATFPPAVLRFADAFQDNPLHLQGSRLGVANADITHVAHLVHRSERYEALVNLLLLSQHDRCLVFVRMRSHAAEIAERLGSDGFLALPFSGDLPQAQRTRTLNAFRNGVANVLVATDVAARGIDVADIATVIHVDLDVDPEIYTHRSGRTGRAGRPGQSILLVPHDSEGRVKRLLRGAKVEAEWTPLPNPARVRKTLTKRVRKQLHALLDGDTPAPEKDLAYAQDLLEGRDPAPIVAHLLRMAEPTYPREPAEITPIQPGAFQEDQEDSRGPRRGAPSRGRRPYRSHHRLRR